MSPAHALSLFAACNQTLCDVQGVHRPKTFWTWVPHSFAPSLRATIQNLFSPLLGYGIKPIYSPKKCSRNGSIRIGVPAAHNCINNALVQSGSVQKLPNRVL